MAQGRGGGPSSPWQTDSNMGNNRQESRPNNARGYSIPSSTNNKGRFPNSGPPQNRQGWGDARRDPSSSSYQRSSAPLNRDRDQHFDKRRNPNDYRTNGFERGFERDHRPPARYNDDDRGRTTNRGVGYENNYDNRRSMDKGWDRNMNRNDRGGNYRETRDFSSHHSNSSQYNANDRRDMMGGESNRYDEDRRRNPGPPYRDLRDHPRAMEQRGHLARGREREFRHNGDSIDYHRRQPPQQRPRHERGDFHDNRYENESHHTSTRYSMGREERLGDSNNFGRDGYGYEQSRHYDQRWEATPSASTSRGRDYHETNDSSRFSHEHSRENQWNREGPDHRRTEWSRSRQGEGNGYEMNGYSDKQNYGSHGDGKIEHQEKQSFGQSHHRLHADTPEQNARSSSFTDINNENNERKRQREDNSREPTTTTVAAKTDTRESPSATSKTNSIATKERQEYDQNKKLKVTSSTATAATFGSRSGSKNQDRKYSSQTGTPAKLSTFAPSSQTKPDLHSRTKIHDKSNTKNIPVKSSSVPSKHQIQAKPKPAIKLGIPMAWLKPKAKPKPPVKKISHKISEDTSKINKIPLKQSSKKAASRPSSPSNRLVTDSSEDGVVMSSKNANNAKVKTSSVPNKKKKPPSVPTAIVTKKKKKKASITKRKPAPANDVEEKREDEWDSEAESDESDGDASKSDIDDDEVPDWASKVPEGPASPSTVQGTDLNDSSQPGEVAKAKSPKLKIRLSAALKSKLNESAKPDAGNSGNDGLIEGNGKKLDEATLKKLERQKKKREKEKALTEKIVDQKPEFDHEKAKLEIEEERRKREEAKPLTAKELRKILQEDNFSGGGNQNNWVRRSRRQPNKNLLNSKPVRALMDKLKYNDLDMRVLKMKKYINDPNAPCAVIDAILNAMEENTNCEALYIQNFNEGMRDQQVIHLLRILQQPSCNIWCLNIGENYNVSDSTWERFTKGLIHTKITHMYASEHTITADMKDEIRFTIRENRKKHDMHINPNNLDVIIQCTHCWWNPINAKVLRPFIKKKGYEHVLKDTEGQGLQGSKSMAPTS